MTPCYTCKVYLPLMQSNHLAKLQKLVKGVGTGSMSKQAHTVVWSLGVSSTVFMLSRNFEIVECIKRVWARVYWVISL